MTYTAEEARSIASALNLTTGDEYPSTDAAMNAGRECCNAYADLLERQAAGVTDAAVERVAKAIFEHWRFDSPVAWVPRGNSLRQDVARGYARSALDVWPVAAESDVRTPMTNTAEPVAQGSVSKFGHHPNPAIDFCVEVEALLGEIENRRVGFENGTPSQTELDARIERALSFRVGGDPSAVMAKQQLRNASTAESIAQPEAVNLEPFKDAVSALRRIRDSANDENDANVPRAMFAALTTIGWLEKTGRNLWSLTTTGEEVLAAQPRAVPEGIAFASPKAAAGSAKFLLEWFDRRPCDSSGVSCCIRCNVVALSRWTLEAIAAAPLQEPQS
jgi:hypothetical protein